MIRRCQNRVYALCCCFLPNVAEAEEVAQEAFVQMFRNLQQFAGTAEGLEPWLLAITRHCCIDRIRHNKARLPAATEHQAEDFEEWIPDPGASPELAMASQQEHRVLYRALQQTSPETRDLILLKEIQGLKIEEVAIILDMPVGTVKSKCHRAKLELAKVILTLNTESTLDEALSGGLNP